MNIYKRGRIWWADYTVAGKRYRQSTGTANRKIAETWLANIKTARKMPTFEAAVEVLKILYQKPVEGLLPISGIIEIYERLAKATGRIASAETERKRRNRITHLIAWLEKNRPTVKTIEAITGPIAAAYAEKLAADGLKTKTRRNIIGDLSTTWNMLEKASEAVRNPWPNLAPPDTDGERGKAFTPAQEAEVLDAAKKIGKDWYPICMIMRTTGLRYGDVVKLTRDEIADGVIRLDPHKTRKHGIRVAIPIVSTLAPVIAAIPNRGDYLFPLHSELYGNTFAATRAGLAFREVLDAAGITGPGYTVHSWRHTAATRLAERGVDIETRKRILGHTVDDTARRYDHAEHLDETRRALEAAASA